MTMIQPVFHDPLPPFQMLLSQPCWGIAAGAGTGSIVSLHFGRKLPRVRPVDNPALDPVLRTHQGEAILFIECRWIIVSNEKVRFDSERDQSANGTMNRALHRLLGTFVRYLRVSMPIDEVSIEFDNGDVLTLHTDRPEADDPHDNFTLSYGDSSFIIGPDLGLRIEPRKGVVPILGHTGASPKPRRGAPAASTRR